MAAELTRKLSRRLERRYSTRSVLEAFGAVDNAIRSPQPLGHQDPYQLLEAWVQNMDAQFSQAGGFTNADCPHAFLLMLESPFFASNLPTVLSYILSFFQQQVTRRMAWVIHLLALGAQSLVPELFRLLADQCAVQRLKTYITRDYDPDLKFPALTLLASLCLATILPAAEFSRLDDNFTAYLLYAIEKSRFAHEQTNEAASKLILALHRQAVRRPVECPADPSPARQPPTRRRRPPPPPPPPRRPGLSSTSSVSSASPSPSLSPLGGAVRPTVPATAQIKPGLSRGMPPPAVPPRRSSPLFDSLVLSQRCVSANNTPLHPPASPVIKTLSRERDSCLTFSENLIFMLNREVDSESLLAILDFIAAVLTYPDTYDFFFTNDLKVLIDVTIRELYNLPEDAVKLRMAYIRLLAPIIINSQYCQIRHKAAHLATLLRHLASQSSLAAAPVELRRLIIQTVKLCEDPLAYGPLL
ncbi:pre-rRNA processing [Tieghemiomyces parasiticus]|uniref:Pre-rRNA processing n=1 Tax=Tieghemiomyces parasiticus TaxID=78921 RepID=A0A9W8A5B2_9FUNG|nr:pre-rRNA processing [Tieghemiomyces parasiticus]